MKTTTLNAIRACQPCPQGWQKLLTHLGKTTADDEPLPFEVILDSNGLDDALWCCRAAPQYDRDWRLFAVWCARQVAHLMSDPRSLAALDVAERFANVEASDEELVAAWAAADAAWDAADAAWDAAWAAAGDAAWNAAWNAARAAWNAANAAWNAARAANAANAAWNAANAAWNAANAAGDAAWNTTWNAARAAARAAQEAKFRRIIQS